MTKEQQYIKLMQQMADMTLPECKNTCRLPFSCCSPEYCAMVIDYAKEYWDVELKPTDHPKLPLLGPNGCIAEPHLRPLCTFHTCEINSMACKRGDLKWTERYFKLRDRIDVLMFELGK